MLCNFRIVLLLVASLGASGCASSNNMAQADMVHINYTVTVRSLGYQLELLEVRHVNDSVWSLARLIPPRPDALVGMALDSLTLSQRVDLPPSSSDRVVRHFIIANPDHVLELPDSALIVRNRNELPDAFQEAYSATIPR